MNSILSDEEIIAATDRWVTRAVIGLNLCPFARAARDNKQVRYVVSNAKTPQDLLADLMRELELIAEASRAEVDTTLLIHPYVLQDFLDYNDFLGVVDDTLEEMELDGILQVASLHPEHQFADTDIDDIENYTSRSPYPTLHILREASIAEAVANYPEADRIFERNVETLRRLGHAGWEALGIDAPEVPKE